MGSRVSCPDRDALPELGIAVDAGDLGSGTEQRDLLDFAVAAEDAGVRSFWLGESYPTGQPAFHLPDPLLMLAHIAAGTRTMTLGTGVLLLNAWSPRRLAYAGALADRLCGGRLVLGVAAGRAGLATTLGSGTALRSTGIDDFLAELRTAWRDGSPDAVCPSPYRPDGPPLVVGGRLPAAARRAAMVGDGWYGSSTYGSVLVASQAAIYRAHLPAGRAAQVSVNRFTIVRADDAQAQAVAVRYLLPVIERYLAHGSVRLDPQASPPGDARAVLDELAIVGSPATVTERLQEYARSGATSIQLRVRMLGMPWQMARDTLDELNRSHLVATQTFHVDRPRRRLR